MATIGSLFSGIGGLEKGLEMAIPSARVLWQCDSDPYARAVLEAHWPGVKRYNDVREIDERAERPDIICGGFPCQPVSVAGKRKAQADTRWLWPFFATALAAVRPRFVFIENVPGLRTAGLRDVLADLAALGFDAEWDLFSAEETGAPHRRQRLFLLAYSGGLAQRKQPWGRSWSRGADTAVAGHDGGDRDVADADGERQLQQGRPVVAERGWAGDGGKQLARADGAGLETLRRTAEPPHAEPAERCGSGDAWPVEPDVGRVAHGVPARAHRLRLLGNACVPAQAALAFRTLMARIATAPTGGDDNGRE